jgi:hypothetical protein
MKMKNQKELITMFSNLIKVNHDGIIISSGENILLLNKQTSTIFGTDPLKSDVLYHSNPPKFDSDGNLQLFRK